MHDNAHPVPAPASVARRGKLPILAIASAVVAVGLAVFFLHPFAPSAPAHPAALPRASVVVHTVAEQKIRLWSEFSGRLRAVDYAEIRPEVSGRITEIRFEDGQSVQAGDILVVIDPRPYEAAVAKAAARVASAQATLRFTSDDKKRATSLLGTEAIAQREYDQADNADGVAAAELQSAQAELKDANLDLEHAYVRAPFAGRVSRAEITVGNLVQKGAGAPLLTSIASQDGIYADFEVDEQTYLATVRDAARDNAGERRIPVELVAQGDPGHPYPGFIESFDNRLDAASGTIRARARFANADGSLVPGMFVSVKLAESREHEALLVPERAVSSDQSKKFVYVVDPSGKVVYREVALGRRVRELRVVDKGLAPGDRVVVDGLQRVRPDALVDAIEAAPSAPVADAVSRDENLASETTAR